MLSNTQRLNFGYLKIIHIIHPRYHRNIIGHTQKNNQKSKCVCINEIIRFILIKMKMKEKNRSNRCDIKRPRSRLGHKYSKYKMCLSVIMLLFIKQHLGNIWSSIHEKVKQHWIWVEKMCCLQKSRSLLEAKFGKNDKCCKLTNNTPELC